MLKNNLLITLNPDHNIGHHYEIESNKNSFLQYMDFDKKFFEQRLDHCLLIPQNTIFNEFMLEEFSKENSKDEFEYLSNITFTNFFKSSNVDVPRCFKRTKTIRRPINEIEILKLNNYLMRQGKRYKTFKFLAKSMNQTFNSYINENIKEFNEEPDWKQLFLTLNFLTKSKRNYQIYSRKGFEFDNYGYQLTPEGSHINFKLLLNPVILNNIYDMLPMFSFYVYKVDKKIFKNTRGKSGKFILYENTYHN